MARPIKSLWLFLLSLLGLHGTSAFAQNADVLCIPGASGDSTVIAGCIDVLSWSWGAGNSGPPTHIDLSDVSFMKQTDSASEDLFMYLVTEEYDAANPDENSLAWDDERVRHLWSTSSPILSARDASS